MSAAGYGLDDKVSKSGDTMSGTLELQGTPPLAIPAGAAAGKVGTSDADGNFSWDAPSGVVDWLNAVSEYGADPTGAADSTTAIQNALNAAAGQPVYLPKGIYKTSSPLTLPTGSVLLGDSSWDTSAFGDVGTVIKPSASFTGTSVIYMADSGSAETQGNWIRNIGIDGSSLAVTADGIRAFGPVVKVFIEDVVIASCTGWGINQLADSGVSSGNQCPYSWRVKHVYFSSCAEGGANLPGHTDSTWTDVEAIGCGNTSGHGFAITGAPSNSHFTNCRAEWTGTGDGFHLTGSWNTGTASGGFTMTGCSTDRNQQNGFYCNATGYAPVIASNCTFRRDGRNSKSGGGSYAGINASSATIPVFFSLVSVFPGTDDDGTGTNSPEYGVSFASSTYVQILSGYIQGATAGVNGTVSGSQLIAPNVIVASGATSGPSTQLTDWYRQSSGIMQSDNDIQLVSGWITAQRFNASGITGATAASRYVGAIASGTAPASGTFSTGDWMIVQTGGIIVCTAGGTQGTWVSSASLALPLAGGTMSGAIAMGSHKITGLASGSASGDAAAFGQIPAWYNVKASAYGATGNGTTDDTSAIQAAITACVAAGGGVVYLPAGTYKIAGNISQAVTNTPVYIIGDGRWCTFLNFAGSGDCIRLYDTQVANTSTKWGGCIKGLTIDGTSHTSTAAAGLHIGDLFQYELDVAVQNFTATGDIGAHLDSQYYYTEQLRGDIFISNCTTGVAFDANSTSGNVTGSFYRADLNIWLNQNTYAYNGVTFLNGTYIVDGALHIRGNFTGGASGPTSSGPWVLGLTGEGPAGRQDAGTFSFLAGCNLDIQVECDSTAAHGPYDIYFDASFTGYITNTYGVLDFLVAETTTFTACNVPGQISNYWGPVNGDTLPNLLPLMNSNLGSGTQLINSTTAANITNLTVAVGATFTAYRIRAYIPYSSTFAAGTPVFAFAGPAIAVINVNYQFQTASTPWVGAPAIATSSPTMTGPVLSTAAGLALLIEGTIAFSAAGTFAITAKEGTASDTFTIGAGAYVELILQNTG